MHYPSKTETTQNQTTNCIGKERQQYRNLVPTVPKDKEDEDRENANGLCDTGFGKREGTATANTLNAAENVPFLESHKNCLTNSTEKRKRFALVKSVKLC